MAQTKGVDEATIYSIMAQVHTITYTHIHNEQKSILYTQPRVPQYLGDELLE